MDDGAIIGGVGLFHNVPVTVIAQAKGHNTKENIKRNFGMPKPEGYRKALRLMKQAEKFHRPIICLVDTPGAFCGVEAEMRGQGEAIAKNLFEMSDLKTPVWYHRHKRPDPHRFLRRQKKKYLAGRLPYLMYILLNTKVSRSSGSSVPKQTHYGNLHPPAGHTQAAAVLHIY